MLVCMLMGKIQRMRKVDAGKMSLSTEGGWNLRNTWRVEPCSVYGGSVMEKKRKLNGGAHM